MKYFHNDNRADGSDHFSRLRLLLLVPSLIGECLVVLSIPQLSLFCHEVAMMILGGSLPCAALQVYISPHETGVAEAKRRWPKLSELHLYGIVFFLWFGCLAHCASIDSYMGMFTATIISAVVLGFNKLLWQASESRGMSGGAGTSDSDCQVENNHDHEHEHDQEMKDVMGAAVVLGATMLFALNAIFESVGCVGLSYHLPASCANLVMANLIVVIQAALSSILECSMMRTAAQLVLPPAAAVAASTSVEEARGPLSPGEEKTTPPVLLTRSYHHVLMLRLEGRELLAFGLTIVTFLFAAFSFSARFFYQYHKMADDEAKEAGNLTTASRVFLFTWSFIWLSIVVLCRKIAAADGDDAEPARSVLPMKKSSLAPPPLQAF